MEGVCQVCHFPVEESVVWGHLGLTLILIFIWKEDKDLVRAPPCPLSISLILVDLVVCCCCSEDIKIKKIDVGSRMYTERSSIIIIIIF